MRVFRFTVAGVSLLAGASACTTSGPTELLETRRISAPIDVVPPEGLTYVLARIERQTAAPFVIADLRDCADGIGTTAEAVYDSLHFQADGRVYRAVARRSRGFANGVEDLTALRVSRLRGAGSFARIGSTVQVVTLMRGGEHPAYWDTGFRIQGDDLVLRMTSGGRCGDGSQRDAPRPADWTYTIAR